MLCHELDSLDRRNSDANGGTSVPVALNPSCEQQRQVWSTAAAAAATFLIVALIALTGTGCGAASSLFANSDPALRKKPEEFAADAAKRHPFKADLPRGGEAVGRAQVNYGTDKIELTNFSEEDWEDVEIWVNRTYVVAVPRIAKGGTTLKTLEFQILFDSTGHSFPTNNTNANQVRELEMLRGGKIYDIRFQLAD